MSQSRARALRRTTFFTDYERQSDSGGSGGNAPGADDFVIPEDLSTLTDEQLASLHSEAIGHFDTLYNGGEGLTEEAMAALSVLTEGIEGLQGELSTRREAADQRAAAAAELATRVHTETRTEEINDREDDAAGDDDQGGDGGDDEDESGEGDGGGGGEGAPEGQAPAAVVAGAPAPRREVRVNLSSVRSQRPVMPRQGSAPTRMQDLVFASGDGTGYAAGAGVNWRDIGRIVDRRLAGFNEGQYRAAQRAGQHLAAQHSVAVFQRPIPQDLMIQSSDPDHVEEVFARAVDQSRLQGGSLVAAGGWCAPSEILYDFLELESRDGLFSMPEIGIARGGIQWTTGIDYSTIYAATDWSYTEAQDEAGTYAVTDDADHLHPGSGSAGDKPCYTVPCPTWDEERLAIAGLCLNAGLLQQRGYPEMLGRTTRGALVAHDHKMSVRLINLLVAGSTAVTMTTGTVGTLAPLLSAIEKQVEHYRYIHRLARNTVLEAVFPYWVHGAVRTDIALRQGLTPVESVEITDAQINMWFASRGIAAQFVYDWQPLTGTAANFTEWPSTVDFLLYVAGTWVKGASDVITLDTIYDSALLGQNNFTALFTEEGYLVAKRWIDSRVITVPICSNGGTGAPIQLGCDGTALVVDQVNPVPGTSAVSAEDGDGFTLTVTGASDAGVGLHDLPYRFTLDAQSATPTWTAWQASAVYSPTGLDASTTYHTRHEVRDLVGNVAAGAGVDATTTA